MQPLQNELASSYAQVNQHATGQTQPEPKPPTLLNNKELQLRLDSTLQELTLHEAYIESNCPGVDVTKLFEASPLLPGIIVTKQGEFLGMISRRRFYEYMSRPYSLELFLKRPLNTLYPFVQTDMLVLDKDTSIVTAVRQSLERSPELIYEPVVVQISLGIYRLLDVHKLLLAQVQIHELATAALRKSELQSKQQTAQLEQTLHDLHQTQAQLIQTEKMSSLGQMVAGIAHEINNPVNFISGNLSYASQYTEDLLHLLSLYQKYYSQPVPEITDEIEDIELDFIIEDLPKIMSSMHLGADRIGKIVLSLRNFSRLDEAEMKPVDIHEGLDTTLLILQNRLKERAGQPKIVIRKEYGDLPLLECYAGQLNQVFMNIISNAIDALESLTETGENGNLQIKISTEILESGNVAITIADNGAGMTEEVRTRLFDPFFTTKPAGKGTGLGLSISYQIVIEKHGGQLSCVSEVGRGTQFVIEIPTQISDFKSAGLCLNS